MTTSTNKEATVISATVRNADDQLHIECRMSDGQKGAFIQVDAEFPELAARVCAALPAQEDAQAVAVIVSQYESDAGTHHRLGWFSDNSLKIGDKLYAHPPAVAASPSVQGESIDSDRAAFEVSESARHLKEYGYDPLPGHFNRSQSGEYKTGFMESRWEGWQARARLARTAAPSNGDVWRAIDAAVPTLAKYDCPAILALSKADKEIFARAIIEAAVPSEGKAIPALTKLCDQLAAMKKTSFLRPGTGQHYSYLVHEDVAAYVEQARAAAPAAEAPILPPMPKAMYKHPKLGDMFDRLQMHFYATRHAEGLARLYDIAVADRASATEQAKPIIAKHAKRDDFTQSTATGYAQFLAWAIWRDHFKAASPDFEILPDVCGVLSQIDNMVCGWTAPTEQAKPELAELKRLAEAATPGPWETRRLTDDECSLVGYSIHGADGTDISDDDTAPNSRDAQYIAAANPAVILRLLAILAAQAVPQAAAKTPKQWKDRMGKGAPIEHAKFAMLEEIEEWRTLFAAQPVPQASGERDAGIEVCATLIDRRAADYLGEHASTDPDTGAVEFHCRDAGRDYHSTLVELADDLRCLKSSAATTSKPEGSQG